MDRAASMKIADDSTVIRKFEMQDGAIFALAFSPDGSRIAVAGAADDVSIYQTETGERTATCKGHKGTYAVAFSPDGGQLATGGFDGKVRICEVPSGKLVRDFVPVPVETQVASAR
jgi:WD40 repeat protein